MATLIYTFIPMLVAILATSVPIVGMRVIERKTR